MSKKRNRMQIQHKDIPPSQNESAAVWNHPWRRLPHPFRLAFLSACLIGAVTHIYVFTNLLLNHDSVWRIYYDNDVLSSGRWSLEFFSNFSTYFQLPVVIALISILMLALTAGITVVFLDISHKLSIILTAAFIVTFPSVACIFSYMYTADAYFIALFLNAAAAYLAKRYRFGWIPAVLLCATACGIYQAFICYAIGLFLLDCIFNLLSKKPIPQIIRDGIRYIGISIGSLVLYYVVLKLILLITGTTLVSYQGLDSMSLKNIGKFILEVPPAYHNFLQFFLHCSFFEKFYQVIQNLLLVLSAFPLLYLIISSKIYRELSRILLLILTIALIPLALNFITVLSIGAWVHALMIYAFLLLYVFIIKLFENAAAQLKANGQNGQALFVCHAVLAFILIWNNFCISNVAYLRLQVNYEASFALANRIVARVEVLDGYSPNLPVAVVGNASTKLFGNKVSQFSKFNSLTGTTDSLLYSPETSVRTRNFIQTYIGFNMPRPNGEQIAMLKNSGVIEDMPSYPSEGSVLIYNDVIVIKLSDGEVR